MRRITSRRPSPAMGVAFLALLVSLGGTSYAVVQLPRDSVGSTQLKRSAVTSSKVKDGSLLRRDFRAGQLPRGRRGLTGERGPAGAQGPPGPANVTVRVGPEGVGGMAAAQGSPAATSVTALASGVQSGLATVSCPSGQKATGGGGFSLDGFLVDSRPDPAPGTPTGWQAEAEVSGGAPAFVQAYVICAEP
jgi:hypothetical protein